MSWSRLLWFAILVELLVVLPWNCVTSDSTVWYKATTLSTQYFFLLPCSQWDFLNSSANCRSDSITSSLDRTRVAAVSIPRADFVSRRGYITAFSVSFTFISSSGPGSFGNSFVKISQLLWNGTALTETFLRPNATMGGTTQTPSCVVVIRSACYKVTFTLVAAASARIARVPSVFIFAIDTVSATIETCAANSNVVVPNIALSTLSASTTAELTLSSSLSTSSTTSASFSLSNVASEYGSQTLTLSFTPSVTLSAGSGSVQASLIFSMSVSVSTSLSLSTFVSKVASQTLSKSLTQSLPFSVSASVNPSDTVWLPLSVSPYVTKTANHTSSSVTRSTSNTVSFQFDPPSPPPLTDAPITAATAVVAVSVNVATAMLAASAAGGALMQATLGASHCAKSSSSQDGQEDRSRSIQPTMYLVTPFYGVNGFAMVFGNVALVLLCALVHAVVSALMHRLVPHMGGGGAQRVADVLAYYRFPNFSILPAVYAVQGITLGGWGLLWDVINPISSSVRDGGAAVAVANIVTWIVSIVYPAALLWWLWRLRVSLIAREGNAVARVEKYASFLFAPLNAVGASTVGADRLHEALIPHELLPRLAALRFLGPRMCWTPRNTRLIFGAAFNAYEPTSTLTWTSLLWLAGDVVLLPTTVSIASTTKPTAESRWAVCNGVMLCGGMLLLMHSVALALARPYRTGARNLLSPLVVLWTAVTCMLSSPLLTDTLGPGSTNDALGSVSAMQSITVLLLAVSNIVIFVAVDQRIARMECSGSDEMGEMKDVAVSDLSIEASHGEFTTMFDDGRELPFLPVGSSNSLNIECLPSRERDTETEWDSFADSTVTDAGFLYHLQPGGIVDGEAEDDERADGCNNIAEFRPFGGVEDRGGPSELVQMYSAMEEHWTEDNDS